MLVVFWKSATSRCNVVPAANRTTHVSLWWQGLALVPGVQLSTIFGVPELLFTHAKTSARAAEAAIAIRASASSSGAAIVSAAVAARAYASIFSRITGSYLVREN